MLDGLPMVRAEPRRTAETRRSRGGRAGRDSSLGWLNGCRRSRLSGMEHRSGWSAGVIAALGTRRGHSASLRSSASLRETSSALATPRHKRLQTHRGSSAATHPLIPSLEGRGGIGAGRRGRLRRSRTRSGKAPAGLARTLCVSARTYRDLGRIAEAEAGPRLSPGNGQPQEAGVTRAPLVMDWLVRWRTLKAATRVIVMLPRMLPARSG